jgi:hypothetical protein
MMKRIALAAALCALAGCAVPMQTVDASRAACAAYGFQPGSDAFAECVMTEQMVHTLVLVPTDAPAVAAPQLDPNPLGIGTSGSGGGGAWSAVGPGGVAGGAGGAWSGAGPGWAASGVGGAP